MILTHKELEKLAITLQVIGNKRLPILAYSVSQVSRAIKGHLIDIQAARKEIVGFPKFLKLMDILGEKYAKRTKEGLVLKKQVPANTSKGWVYQYEIADVNSYARGLRELEQEYSEIIRQEDIRLIQLQELLDSPVDLDFPVKIKYSWCKELLSGNDMNILLSLDLLEMDEVPEVPEGSKNEDGTEDQEDSKHGA